MDIAFVVPLQGPTGMYGPSCIACGELAAHQLNLTSGIAGSPVTLRLVDAGRDPEVVADEVAFLVASGQVQAIAGWHISAVRRAITRKVGGHVVYAYAAMHEGYDHTPGVFMLGERPANQLVPATAWMRENLGARRWMIVGNDYVFPRVTAASMHRALRDSPSSIAGSVYVPLGTTDFTDVIAMAERANVDGIMMLLMGQDAVQFNRAFGRAGLADRLTRLSPAVEENTLLGAGAAANRNLYAAAAYFESLGTEQSSQFERAYRALHGPWAPTLNAVGESCYEAVMFLAWLAKACGGLSIEHLAGLAPGAFYDGPRGLSRWSGNLLDQDVYIAAADDVQFHVHDHIARAT